MPTNAVSQPESTNPIGRLELSESHVRASSQPSLPSCGGICPCFEAEASMMCACCPCSEGDSENS